MHIGAVAKTFWFERRCHSLLWARFSTAAPAEDTGWLSPICGKRLGDFGFCPPRTGPGHQAEGDPRPAAAPSQPRPLSGTARFFESFRVWRRFLRTSPDNSRLKSAKRVRTPGTPAEPSDGRE